MLSSSSTPFTLLDLFMYLWESLVTYVTHQVLKKKYLQDQAATLSAPKQTKSSLSNATIHQTHHQWKFFWNLLSLHQLMATRQSTSSWNGTAYVDAQTGISTCHSEDDTAHFSTYLWWYARLHQLQLSHQKLNQQCKLTQMAHIMVRHCASKILFRVSYWRKVATLARCKTWNDMGWGSFGGLLNCMGVTIVAPLLQMPITTPMMYCRHDCLP